MAHDTSLHKRKLPNVYLPLKSLLKKQQDHQGKVQAQLRQRQKERKNQLQKGGLQNEREYY